MSTPKIDSMSFAKVSPLHIAKAERKSSTNAAIIEWPNGYGQPGPQAYGQLSP